MFTHAIPCDLFKTNYEHMKPAVRILSHSYLSQALAVVLLFTCGIIRPGLSQSIYHTGSQEPVSTRHAAGVLLAGGATDNDDAMRWMLRQADGGDVVVLRASGSDGYNRYFFLSLAISVNSVTSIVITTAAHANSEEVIDIVKEAEVVFIAGGNQWNYVRHWRGTRLLELAE
jgi:cyanophycinase-like exopeptidase